MMKTLLTRNQFLKINEEAPFANDIAWGDSLVGRLINSIIRKTSIQYNRNRINGIIDLIKAQFDQMVENIKVSKKDYDFISLSTLIGQLEKDIENGDIEKIKKTANDLKEYIILSEIEDKEKLLRACTEFIKYLNSIKGNEEEKPEQTKDEAVNEFCDQTIILFQSVIDLSNDIKNNEVQFTGSISNATASTTGTASGGTSSTPGHIINKNVPTPQKSGEGASVKVESLKHIYEGVKIDDKNAISAWKKILNAFNKSGIDRYVGELSKLIKNKDNKESKIKIFHIGDTIVKSKITTGKPISTEELLKEGIDEDLSKSISLVARVILAFSGDEYLSTGGYIKNPTKLYGKASDHIKSFISSFNKMEKIFTEQREKKKNIEQKESIFNYKKFLMIKEANEAKKTNTLIKEKFDELLTKDLISKFNMDDSKKHEIESRVGHGGKQININTSDPIIEIARLCNRAWRIHTPGVIPSGRTDGKVSNAVFREYEYVGDSGGGTPTSPGSGPYRNIKLFESWHTGMNEILADAKYRPIFSDSTIIQIGKGDPVEGGGKILLKFITQLIDGASMYKKGAMAKFLEEYFHIDGEKSRLTYTSPDQEEKIIKSADDIKNEENLTEVEFIEVSDEDVKQLLSGKNNTGTILKMDNHGYPIYFEYIKMTDDNENIYFPYSENKIFFDISKLKFKEKTPETNPETLFYGQANITENKNINRQLNVKYVDINTFDYTNPKGSKIKEKLFKGKLFILKYSKKEGEESKTFIPESIYSYKNIKLMPNTKTFSFKEIFKKINEKVFKS